MRGDGVNDKRVEEGANADADEGMQSRHKYSEMRVIPDASNREAGPQCFVQRKFRCRRREEEERVD